MVATSRGRTGNHSLRSSRPCAIITLVEVAKVVDELARIAFSVDTSGMSAKAITALLTREIVTWALSKGWSVKTEARVEPSRVPRRRTEYGYIDVVVRPGEGLPDLAIEIDQTDKPWSIAKLQYAMALGMEAVWIRWSGADWIDVEGIHVIHLPETDRRLLQRTAPAQLRLW